MVEKTANKVQVGGDHYKVGGEEHWDRVDRLGLDYFQGQITKYVERWKLKNGVEDLKKARHFLDKYIELNTDPGNPEPMGNGPKGVFNTPLEDAILFGPMSGTGALSPMDVRGPDAFAAAVKPSGYVGFVYEGGTAEWDLYKCNACRTEVKTPVGKPPHCGYCGSQVEIRT